MSGGTKQVMRIEQLAPVDCVSTLSNSWIVLILYEFTLQIQLKSMDTTKIYEFSADSTFQFKSINPKPKLLTQVCAIISAIT